MGRRRRRIYEWLPKGAYVKGRAIVYRPYLGVSEGKPKFGKDKYLCSVNAPRSAFWTAYERETGERKDTLAWLLKEYFKSKKFNDRGQSTQEAYRGYAETLIAHKTADGRNFGEVQLIEIDSDSIQSYLETYTDKTGRLAPVSANRQIQFLRAAWNVVGRRNKAVPQNPCAGVDLNEEESRDRYVSQAEFAAFKATTRGYIPIFMEIAYLCRARWSEVSNLKVSDMVAEGLILRRNKGSEGEITANSPRLLGALAAAKAYNQSAPSPITGAYLIHDKKGRKISRNAFQSAWGRAMRAWVAAGKERFTFHDLKAAGYSDQIEQFAGHKSEKMHRIYNRKLRIVEPPA